MRLLKSIIKQSILNFKVILNSSFFLSLFFLIPLMTTLVFSVFLFSAADILGTVLIFPQITVLMLIYWAVTGEFKNSSLSDNLNSYRSSKIITYCSSLLVIFVSSYFLFFLTMSFLITFGKLSWLSTAIIGSGAEGTHFEFIHLPWFYVMYWYVLNALLIWCVSFCINSFVKSSKNFAVVILTIDIWFVIFGGAFNDYFGTGGGWLTASPDDLDTRFMNFRQMMFPTYMYIPSIMFPFYSQSQMLNIAGKHTLFKGDGTLRYWYWGKIDIWEWQSSSDYIVNGLKDDSWRFNILYFLPYLHMSLWTTIGLMKNKA